MWSFGDNVNSIEVPDFVGSLVGYRMWRRDPRSNFLLSPVQGAPWRVGTPFKALCAIDLEQAHACPSPISMADEHPGYGCGIYSWSSFELFVKHGYASAGLQGFRRKNLIIGTTHVWGSCVQQEHGWRSEYGAVRSIFNTGEASVITAVKYDVPLETLPEELTYKGRLNRG